MPETEAPKNKILFVSSEPESKYGLNDLLKVPLGKLQLADSRIRADQLASKTKFDLIIADMDIPKTTGTNFCKTLRSNKKTQNASIVIVGEDDDSGSNCIAAFAAGADDFIPYPFLPDVCVARMKRWFREKAKAGAASFLSLCSWRFRWCIRPSN